MTNFVTTDDGIKLTLFFSIRSPFSNFYPCSFVVIESPDADASQTRCFYSTEQYYMYNKALSCNDVESAQQILNEKDPRKIKSIGKKLKNFNLARWNELSERVMRLANRAKYTQNSRLRMQLFCTSGSTLVECSPTDNVWGIGIDIHEPDALNPSKWRGQNKLGYILTEIREELWSRPEYCSEISNVRKLLIDFDAISASIFLSPKPRTHAKRLSLPSNWVCGEGINSLYDNRIASQNSSPSREGTHLKRFRSTNPEVDKDSTWKLRRMTDQCELCSNSDKPYQNNAFVMDHENNHKDDARFTKYDQSASKGKDSQSPRSSPFLHGNFSKKTSRSRSSSVSNRSPSLERTRKRYDEQPSGRSSDSYRCCRDRRHRKSAGEQAYSDSLINKHRKTRELKNTESLFYSSDSSESRLSSEEDIEVAVSHELETVSGKSSFESLIARLRMKPSGLWAQSPERTL